MAFDQIPTSVTIINSGLIGYQGISLTDFTLSSASLIAAGSSVEIAGSFFKASTDITPNASSWAAITTGTSAYLELTPSGTAGSQALTAAWSSTAPTWSTSKQGWYTSAGSNVRTVAKAYKNSTTSYLGKRILNNSQDLQPVKHNWQGAIERILTGSGNWTVPSDVYQIRVTCVGGGGGGSGGGNGGSGDPGINGSSTTFAGATTGAGGGRGGDGGVGATGGAGAPGGGSAGAGGGAGGIIGIGASAGGTGNYGGGGGCGRGATSDGFGGGGTNISLVIGDVISVIPGETKAYSVGAGGAGGAGFGSGATAGGAGGSGIIIIEY